MTDTKTLLVIQPSVQISKSALREIEAAGFVVVRGDPAQFTVVGNTPPMSEREALVLRVALETIQNLSGVGIQSNDVRWKFGVNLAAALGYGDVVKMK